MPIKKLTVFLLNLNTDNVEKRIKDKDNMQLNSNYIHL